MEKPIQEGCLAEIVGYHPIPDGTVVEVLFKTNDFIGEDRVWTISEHFKNHNDVLTNLIVESLLRRLDDDGKELCTSWEDVKLISGWVPEHLKEVA